MNPSLTNARLSWDETGIPHSLDYGDVYYSRADALGESSHVFIAGNELPARFAAANGRFCVGELGFGAGLNFLNCCRAFCATAAPVSSLHYLACELHPFTLPDLQRWLARFAELAPWRDALLAVYPAHTAGVHQLVLRLPLQRITLTLLYGDAVQLLSDFGRAAGLQMDAWFLDGFSPKLNPALWQTDLLREVARLSHAGTTLSSYSAAAPLKQALQQTGFRYRKSPGFAGKRHMLQAEYTGERSTKAVASRQAVIVGGGISGCSTAFALAESGWQITLLESENQLAAQGSGNRQGVLHCKPGTAASSDNHFNLHAYLHAQRHYAALAEQGLPWHQCGMLHVGVDAEQLRRFARIHQSGRFHPDILQAVSAEQASRIAGVPLAHACLYFPLSGWLAPAELCRFYTQHSRIEVRTGARVRSLHRTAADEWLLDLHDGSRLNSPVVILCTAADAYEFPYCHHLPFIVNRGQVDVYAAAPATAALNTVLCGQGYITPASNGLQSLGGSYYVEATTADHNRRTHLALLAKMDRALSGELATQAPVEQRIGQRCQTPDRMPLAGLVSADLPGLYINAAHGSNGLARTPICAALITSLLEGTPAPLSDRLCQLVDPARFA